MDKISALSRLIGSSMAFRSDSLSLDNIDGLEKFVAGRAAFVSQKKLYGYLKERIGTRWPSMFEDEVFRTSIATASMQVFAASLSDLTIHAVAHALSDSSAPDEVKAGLAHQIYVSGLQKNQEEATEDFDRDQVIAEFDRRLQGTDWNFGALLPENFTRSPAALLKWAPIADRHKKFDAEIVENSLKFAWVDIREQLARRLDADAIAREVSANNPRPEG
ncbi:hypothetical protein [Anderseniella sp. Alg231-50]|uniref:hypothetical protein n=1 Tax=Anderseniella sp. Alg231-50 TaxID=1922226 RepID=UPI00307B29EA